MELNSHISYLITYNNIYIRDSGRAQKKSEVGCKMVRKNFSLQIWVLCNPKIGTFFIADLDTL
jgi:hypothetical protein